VTKEREDRKPSWTKWRHVPNVKLWEAVALSLDIEPGLVNHSPHGRMSNSHLFDKLEFKDRIFIATRNLSTKGPLVPIALVMGKPESCKISLAGFSTWARSIDWDIPPELGGEIDLQNEDQQNNRDPIDKPLQTRERNTLLTIIAALAEIAEIDISVPHSAAEAIAHQTQHMDCPIGQKTIANKLKDIPDALGTKK